MRVKCVLEFFAAASGNAADVVLGLSVFIHKGWSFLMHIRLLIMFDSIKTFQLPHQIHHLAFIKMSSPFSLSISLSLLTKLIIVSNDESC